MESGNIKMSTQNTFITEPPRQTPVTHDVDVVVCGGGTAGIACAVCAARLGLQVVMIEQTAQPGGMVTSVTQWTGDMDNKGGFVREFFAELTALGIYRRPYYNGFQVVGYFDKLLEDNHVTPLYFTKAVSVIKEGNSLRGVVVESRQGRHAIMGKVIIDATGDGDVAALAGADFEYGRPSDGEVQSISLSMLMQNITGEPHLRDEVAPAMQKVKPDYKLPYDNGHMRKLPGCEAAGLCGLSHLCGCDLFNAEEFSKALAELRRQSLEFVKILNQTPIFGGKVEAYGFSALPGIRESRRIVCDARVSDEDCFDGNFYLDAIFTVRHNIDIHRCKEGEPCIIVEKVNPYHIRFGSLLPAKLENIMVIGRCIGGSHRALASYRLIADCFAMGEAAALAAASAVKENCSPRNIPLAELQKEMKQRGYELP